MITESQLSTWSSAPSKSELERIRNARQAIENVLKAKLNIDGIKRKYGLSSFKYEVYLQGSYANSTNISFDSDVDIVIQFNSTTFDDCSQLNVAQKQLYISSHQDSLYKFINFKEDIYNALIAGLGSENVNWDDKCLDVKENTYRADADVVPCFQYRIFKKFISFNNKDFIEGMKFFDTNDNTQIINFPKIHLKNCESKNVDTEGKFKDLVRIYKNIKRNLIKEGKITKEQAPSYFVENLIYNCTSPCFDGGYQECMKKSLQYIYDAIQTGRITGFVCANEQDTLIDKWNLEDLIIFVSAAGDYFLSN